MTSVKSRCNPFKEEVGRPVEFFRETAVNAMRVKFSIVFVHAPLMCCSALGNI